VNRNNIFLPGADKQIALLYDITDTSGKSVLIIGTGTEKIAEIFIQQKAAEVYIITNDNESLIRARMVLPKEKENIFVRLMDYDNTDFRSEKFDIVYSQGSTGTNKRTKIIKEIKRFLKTNGLVCIGEITSKTENPPAFITNLWKDAGLSPLQEDSFSKFFKEHAFEVKFEKDLSYTLKYFYSNALDIVKSEFKNISPEKLKSHKTILKRIKHEANAYLNLGGDKFIGYRMIVANNNNSK
jgi:ubiquinone/menaquinone biosynthesis C-methylase UbiE